MVRFECSRELMKHCGKKNYLFDTSFFKDMANICNIFNLKEFNLIVIFLNVIYSTILTFPIKGLSLSINLRIEGDRNLRIEGVSSIFKEFEKIN